MPVTEYKNIRITITCGNERHDINAVANEYRSLMQLVYDKVYTEDFGECMGMGRCGTCLVEITTTRYPINYYNRNGAATLRRVGRAGGEVQLACQVMADEFIDGLEATILQ